MSSRGRTGGVPAGPGGSAPAGRCPVCGSGVLADIAYDDDEHGRIAQGPDAHQIETYTCGHRREGAPLRDADDRLDVERRTAEEAAEPLPEA